MLPTAGDAQATWTFDRATDEVLDFLAGHLPLDLWAVTRRHEDDQVFLRVRGESLGVPDGALVPWRDSLCDRRHRGAPEAAADTAQVPQYASAAREDGVRAYVGVPITAGDGSLFGSLCGFNQHPVPEPELRRTLPMMRLLAALLGQILAGETVRELALIREAELRRLATHDDLTGLATRRVLIDRLGHALDLHRADGRPVSVLLIDLDDFKPVNDTHGHATGDALLRTVSTTWSQGISLGNTLCRLGGDEFALLVENGLTPEQITATVEPALVHTHRVEGLDLTTRISVGLVHVGRGAETPTASEVIARADAAMYAAKRSGGARLVRWVDSYGHG